MKRQLGLAAVVACLSVSSASYAQESWTFGGMLNGASAIHSEFGWPGLNFGYMTTMSSSFDLGAHFTFNYGLEGDPVTVVPGIKLAADLKFLLGRSNRALFILDITPGFTSYFGNGDTILGASVPLEFLVGLPVRDNFLIHFGVKVPFFFGGDIINGGGGGAVVSIPIQPGFGLEFKVDHQLSFTFQTRFGPLIFIQNGVSGVDFAFDALFGVTYRF